MPLSAPAERRKIHHRIIDMCAFARNDGLFDVEARLVDRKPFPFLRRGNPVPVAGDEPIHDLHVRLTVDGQYVVRAVEASSDVTPHQVCKEAEATLQVIVGEKIGPGWARMVKERLRGAASCTHLMEMLVTMATTAIQGIRGMDPGRTTTTDEKSIAAKIDSCYAYGKGTELVKMLWPQHYRPR